MKPGRTMAARTEPGGNKGRRYREQVLDEAFLKQPLSWAQTAQFFELSLHSGEPEAPEALGGGLQNEISYPKYERPRLPRDLLTWQRTGNTVSNRIEARFALYQDGPPLRATHWALTPVGEASPTYRGEFEAAMDIPPGTRPVVDQGMISASEM